MLMLITVLSLFILLFHIVQLLFMHSSSSLPLFIFIRQIDST